MQLSLARLVACALLVGGSAASLAQSAVTPPPLPVGSAQARPEPGLSEPERKRYVRAHHNKFHYGRDYTRDDSVYGMQQPVAAPGPLGAGRAGTVDDGRGTGPAREKTDRGASSWFYGNQKK